MGPTEKALMYKGYSGPEPKPKDSKVFNYRAATFDERGNKLSDTLRGHPEAAHARNKRWHHTSSFGDIGMAYQGMVKILNSSTSTDAAKETASKIRTLLNQLREEMKERIDG